MEIASMEMAAAVAGDIMGIIAIIISMIPTRMLAGPPLQRDVRRQQSLRRNTC